MQAVLAGIREDAAPFDDMSTEAVEQRKSLPFLEWCATYLPNHFRCAFAPVHHRIAAGLDEPTMPAWVALARGMGKSTICSIAAPLYRLLNRRHITHAQADTMQNRVPSAPCHFQVFGALTESLATNLMDICRIHLESNLRICADYGDASCRVVGQDSDWVANRVRMLGIGVRQTPRGQLYGEHRPDVAVLDDLEDRFTSKNAERARETRELINSDWIPALEPGAWAMTICLTALGRGGLLEWAKQHKTDTDDSGQPLFKLIFQPVVKADGTSAWPERFTDDMLTRVRAQVGQHAWRQEYLLRNDSPDAPFQPEWIREFSLAALSADEIASMRKVGALDPSATSKETSDFKGIAVVGTPAEEYGKPFASIYCLYLWAEHASPARMVSEMARVQERFGPVIMHCENNGLGDFLRVALDVHEERTGTPLPVRPYHQSGNKEDRILSNVADVENGRCLFDLSQPGQRELVDEMLDFGKSGVHDDAVDAWDAAKRRLQRRGAGGLVTLPDVL